MNIALLNQVHTSIAQHGLRCFWLVCFGLMSLAARAQTPLSLPFFDDFSTAPGRPGLDQPDPTRWRPGSGVYINNTMAVNQPTVNVASFDGLMANGRPYIQNSPLSQGYTDTLKSNPINLLGLPEKDTNSVYLSFYWQAKGVGELPDAGAIQTKPDTVPFKRGQVLKPGEKLVIKNGKDSLVAKIDTLVIQAADSLILQFMRPDNSWATVWKQAGGKADSVFHQTFVNVNAALFHGKFAFQFISYGRASGPFDTWHVDYIYLNKGRSPNEKFVKDVAARRAITPYFKHYTAMPIWQYRNNEATQTADSVKTDMVNLGEFNPTTFRFSVSDDISKRVIQNDSFPNPLFNSQPIRIKLKPAIIDSTAKARLRYKVSLLTSDDKSITGLDLTQNDTLSAVAVLDDYYAYDDGTWEYAQQIRQREQIAVRFLLNKPDAIGGVRACIVPFTTNQTGQSFVISVYNNRAGRPGTVVHQQSFPMQYPASRNGFVEFKFSKSVTVKDTFYVGYQQISSSDTTLLRLGFDKNSPFGSQIFYNGGTNWEQNLSSASLSLQGAFMLRPVMGAKPDTVVTATPEPEPLAPLRVYPNPTSGLVRWDDPRLTRLDVMNSTGQLVRVVEPSRGQQTLDLSYLPDGLYLLRLSADRRTVVQKLIIQH